MCLTKGGSEPTEFMQRHRKWIESRARGLYTSGVSGEAIYGDEVFVAWAVSTLRPIVQPSPGTVRFGYVQDLDRS